MFRSLLLGLLVLLALLLFAPVKAAFVWRGEVLHLTLRLLWVLPVRILPAKEEAPGREKAKKTKKKKREKKPAPKKPPAGDPAQRAVDMLRLVNDMLPHLAASMGYILRRLTLSRCRIALVVGGEEADQVGIACGRAYAAAYAAQSGLRGVIRVKEFVFNVLPDFISGRGAADAEVTLELRPSTLLAGGLLLLWRGAKTLLARRE